MKFFVLLFFAFSGFAGEPDNFSGRKGPVQNSAINSFVQTKLRYIASDHNKQNKLSGECDMSLIEELLKESLDKNFPEVYGLANLTVPDGPVDSSQSIYNDVLPRLKVFYVPSMAVEIQGKKYSIGLDKIDHFFSHGYDYWNGVGRDPKLNSERVRKVMKLGMDQESGVWGLKGPGVKSYADLSANHAGMYFWRDLWHGAPPFFSCEQGQLVITREFKLEDYFNPGMDEAVNCSSYKSAELASQVLSRTKAMGKSCPVDKSACQQLKESYSESIQAMLLHPLCLGRSHSQIETPENFTAADIKAAFQGLSGIRNLGQQFLAPTQSGKGVK